MNSEPVIDPHHLFEATQAAGRGDLAALQRLFTEYGDSLSQATLRAEPLLHAAARGGADAIIDWLIDRNFDVNQLSPWGSSPLFEAVHNDQPSAATLLKQHGAKLRIPQGNKIVAMIQFGIGALALSILLFLITRDAITTGRAIGIFVCFGVFATSILEGIKGFQGKRTFANS